MTTTPTRRRPGCLRIILIAAGVLFVIAIISAITSGGSSDDTTTGSAPAPAIAVENTTSPALTEEQTMTDQQRAALIEQYVLDMHGHDSTAGALIADPDGWVGFVSEVRVDDTRVYVRLQADRAELDTRAERAANWITSAGVPGADDLRWAIVEDATGTVVEQTQFPR